MKTRVLSIVRVATLVLASGVSTYAFSGGFLDKLQKASEGMQQLSELQRQLQPVQVRNDATVSGDLDAACEKLQNNPVVKRYVDLLKELPNGVRFDINFDTEDNLLYKWVFEKESRLDEATSTNINTQLNYCANKFQDSELWAIFQSGGEDQSRLERFKELKNKATVIVPRSIDDDGNIIEEKVVTREVKIPPIIERLVRPYKQVSTDSNTSLDPLLPHALLLGGDKVVENIGKTVFAWLDSEILKAKQEIAQQEQRKKDLEREKLATKTAIANREAELMSGKVQPQNINEAAFKFKPINSNSIITNTPINPDNQMYVVLVRLESVSDSASGGKILTVRGMTETRSQLIPMTRFGKIMLRESSIIVGQLKMNQTYAVVGKFTGVEKGVLTTGKEILMPVIDVEFISEYY